MKIRLEDLKEEEEEAKTSDEMMDWAGKLYQRFNHAVSLNDDDPIWLLTGKVIGRFIGFLIILALSPFFILGLILAFIGAS